VPVRVILIWSSVADKVLSPPPYPVEVVVSFTVCDATQEFEPMAVITSAPLTILDAEPLVTINPEVELTTVPAWFAEELI
jgi:hypothetical protein